MTRAWSGAAEPKASEVFPRQLRKPGYADPGGVLFEI